MEKMLMVLALVAVGCKKNENSRAIDAAAPEASALVPAKTCYAYMRNKDTITLSLSMDANNANGLLDYKLWEKDANTGTISGTFIGDTLYADYTFKSEGTTSVREVVFLREGDKLVEGYGDMEEKDGKMMFVNPKNVSFKTTALALGKVSCD